jgi:WASH complex subunit strumpellin
MLPFCPNILLQQEPKMREICDKHFPDNWIIPIYGGQLVDLEFYWASFPAAMKAFRNNIVQDRIEYFADFHAKQLAQSQKKLKKYIIDGQLQEKEALENVKVLTKNLRDANATIRWIMLHLNCGNAKFRKVIGNIVEMERFVSLLLELSKFETHFKDLITLIVTKKRQVWESNKDSCVKYMNEVAAFFQGERNWGQEYYDEDLAEYFSRIANTIEEFEYKEANKVGRKIQKMLQALEDLQL